MTRERVEAWWKARCEFHEGEVAGELMRIQKGIKELEERVYWASPEGKKRTAQARAEMEAEWAPRLAAMAALIKLMK